jgi:2-oxoglutarate ferredoxin oxidoreductase subunit beta
MAPIDPVKLGLALGATFIARSFSGDKEQLVPILKAALTHRGFALVDVVSPCVTFNDHEGSTKSYKHTRKNTLRATQADWVPPQSEILAQISKSGTTTVTMHDGSVVNFSAVPKHYDPTDRTKVAAYLDDQPANAVVTGLLFIDPNAPDMHELGQSSPTPLRDLAYEKLCPGSAELERMQEEFR